MKPDSTIVVCELQPAAHAIAVSESYRVGDAENVGRRSLPGAGRLVVFIPDFGNLEANSRFSEVSVQVYSEIAKSLGRDFVLIYLKQSLGSKLRSMVSSLVREGFWAASPVLNHFSGAKTFVVKPGDRIVVAFHLNWWSIRRLLRERGSADVFLIVHNIESECRRSRGSTHIVNRLFPTVEKWNVESLRRLDEQLSGCHVGCVSYSDMETLQRMGVACKELRFVGWSTLLTDEDVAAGRKTLTSNSRAVDRTLLLVGNGRNPDTRAGLRWFVDAVVPLLPEPKSWKLVLAGPGWDEFDTKSTRIVIERVGFLDHLSSVLARGMIGINPDRSGVGVKTKMLDYVALGLPAISTSMGVRGFPPDARQSLWVGDGPSVWVSLFQKLRNPEEWSTYSRSLIALSARYATRESFVKRLSGFLLHNFD